MLLLFFQMSMLLCMKTLVDIENTEQRQVQDPFNNLDDSVCDKCKQPEVVNYSKKYLHLRCCRDPKSTSDWGMYSCYVYDVGLEVNPL